MTSNKLSNIRPILDGMQGHNYALPDCIKFIFECMNVYEALDFWTIAAATGDTVAQVYNHNPSTRCEYCVSGYLAGEHYITEVFNTFGLDCEYADRTQINGNKEHYIKKIKEYIDNGIPVLVKANVNDVPNWKSDVGTYCLIVGYQNDGWQLDLLLYDTVTIEYDMSAEAKLELVFTEKNEDDIPLQDIYTKIIKKLPYWLTLPEQNGMHFGADAYRAWASDILAGRFAQNSIDLWGNYCVYVCSLATNGGLPVFIFDKLAELNPAFSELTLLADKIKKLLPTEAPDSGKSMLWAQLEKLDMAMNADKVGEMMQISDRRKDAAKLLSAYASKLEETIALLQQNIFSV